MSNLDKIVNHNVNKWLNEYHFNDDKTITLDVAWLKMICKLTAIDYYNNEVPNDL